MQVTLQMPGCSIMYAPSIDIAKWILGRRKIDLVVSSAILPDGNITRLKSTLENMATPPDVVVVGHMNVRNVQIFGESGYEFLAIRRFEVKPGDAAPKKEAGFHHKIKELGADIRNDLNNPLQEIVAMVFVAQTGLESSPATEQALRAIDNAAKNLARVVNGLEDKIRHAVNPHVGETTAP